MRTARGRRQVRWCVQALVACLALTLTTVAPVAAVLPVAAAADETQGFRLRSTSLDDPDPRPGCTAAINKTVRIGVDESGEEIGRVEWHASETCNFTLNRIQGESRLVDRTDGFDGQPLKHGDTFDVPDASFVLSFGFHEVRASQVGARRVEVVLESTLIAPEGFVWEGCDPIPGLRYLEPCEGLGGNVLHVLIGSNPFPINLQPSTCYNTGAHVTVEESRLDTVVSGSTQKEPTKIIQLIPSINQRVKTFVADLCKKGSQAAAESFADEQGALLWKAAVDSAKQGGRGTDDRALYWARLSMTAAVRRWTPQGFSVNAQPIVDRLERASRGITTSDFGSGAARKIFISGYDPFGLDQRPNDIRRGNPSAAAVLRLDGVTRTIGGLSVEIQAVVLPVRYCDFGISPPRPVDCNTAGGLIEEVFESHVMNGGQQAHFVMTVSQGGSGFDLDYYYGRRRSTDFFPDNMNQVIGSSTDPIVPPGLRSSAEFLRTTLPIDVIKAGTTFPKINTSVQERALDQAGQQTGPPTTRDIGPTIGSKAVEGSGGGFLSNEVAYRVAALREQHGVSGSVASGHVHTPELMVPTATSQASFDNQRNGIATQFQQILEKAVPGSPLAPVTVTVDKARYAVGEKTTYTITGLPGASVVWSSTRDGIPTTELDADYGQKVGPLGTVALVSDPPWDASQVGTWVKQVSVAGRVAQVTFVVEP
jgi:hypothetical protein